MLMNHDANSSSITKYSPSFVKLHQEVEDWGIGLGGGGGVQLLVETEDY